MVVLSVLSSLIILYLGFFNVQRNRRNNIGLGQAVLIANGMTPPEFDSNVIDRHKILCDADFCLLTSKPSDVKNQMIILIYRLTMEPVL